MRAEREHTDLVEPTTHVLDPERRKERRVNRYALEQYYYDTFKYRLRRLTELALFKIGKSLFFDYLREFAFYEKASDCGFDLYLCGHTHGGQVNAVVRPADWVLPFDYVAGLYEREGARLYVNRGFGTAGPPVRIGAPPEVTTIVLVAG